MTDLTITELWVRYAVNGGILDAVQGVSFDVAAGAAVGLVGESGSGKSSLARAVVGITPIAAGSVTVDGRPVVARPGPGGVQMVFQDPIGSLNPSRRVMDLVSEPLRIAGVPRTLRRERAAQMLREVGLDPETFARRRPAQLSGGQAQRVAIGRALLAEPEVLVADEPVSGLDVSVQAGIINLLHRVTVERGMSLLLVSHDLAVVRTLCEAVVVMQHGQVREQGPADRVLAAPRHEYTRELLAAVPTLEAGP
ncbi:MAG TPA: ABC transporter ATP-binding protein [Candidatus Brachybacterium merdigallinarum]|nr:ABC transporter ATP-binding protein [Candidatus Brachybacterium merdigallinarum]